MNNYNECRIDLNGYSINYIEAGEGRPIIFLHNGGGFWQVWSKQIEYFSKTHKVFALDWPGFGNSSPLHSLITLDLLTSILTNFIVQKKLEDVILVGNCIGGSASVNYALQNPSNVKKLVVFNICPGELIFPNKFVGAFIGVVNKTPIVRSLFVSLVKFIYTRPSVTKNFPAVLFGRKYDKSDFVFKKYAQKFEDANQLNSRINLLFSVHTYTLKNLLKGKSAFKNLLLWGAENSITDLEKFSEFHRELLTPEAYHVIPNAGHLCMYEQPEMVNSLISKYID